MRLIIKEATEKDVIDYWRLVNDAAVRKNSFFPDLITMKEHRVWFRKRLLSDNTILLLGRLGDEMVGQCRFDVKGEVAIVSLALVEKYRQKGFGSKILARAIARLKQTRKKVKKIRALIVATNFGSINFFKKNGFVFDKKLKINNIPAVQYDLYL